MNRWHMHSYQMVMIILVGLMGAVSGCGAAQAAEIRQDYAPGEVYPVDLIEEEIPVLPLPDVPDGTHAEGHWDIQISRLRLLSEEEREYDGSDQVSLAWDMEAVYVSPEGFVTAPDGAAYTGRIPDNPVVCSARLSGTEPGEHPVLYQFFLNDEVPDGTTLRVEETELTVTVLPRKLSIRLPNGWKYYHAEAVLDQVHVEGGITVDGFLTDGAGNALVPEGFTMPELSVNTEVLQRDTPIYRNRKQNIIQGGLTVKRRADGSFTGSTGSSCYIFDTETIIGGAVTIQPAEAVRNRDYSLYYPAGAGYETAGGELWLRPDASLSVRPETGSGYNVSAWISESSCVLQNLDADGNLLAESQPFRVNRRIDSATPQLQISVQGGRQQGDMVYADRGLRVELSDPSDEGAGIGSAVYEVRAGSRTGQVLQRGSFLTGAAIWLEQDGEYVIGAAASDLVGNQSEMWSGTIRIDTVPPRIQVIGITRNASVKDPVNIQVRCEDAAIDSGSIRGTIIGKHTGAVHTGFVTMQNGFATIRFPELGGRADQDDVYTLQVQAADFAGNQAEYSLPFTLNSTGSVFSLDEASRNSLENYWHRNAFDLVLYESNLDVVDSMQILCTRNRETVLLDGGTGLVRRELASETGRHLYQYTISAETFAKEGEYEVVLLTEDRAGGRYDTAAQPGRIAFGIDRTAPDCVITGIPEGGSVQDTQAVLVFEPRDNLSFAGMRLYIDGKQVLEKTAEELRAANGTVKYTLYEQPDRQSVQVYVWDQAGNVYRSSVKSVYVNSRLQERVSDTGRTAGDPTYAEIIKLWKFVLRPWGEVFVRIRNTFYAILVSNGS